MRLVDELGNTLKGYEDIMKLIRRFAPRSLKISNPMVKEMNVMK